MRLIDADALNGYKFGLISPYAQNLFHKIINEAPTIVQERKPFIVIDGHTYVAKQPKLKTIHGKTGEVVIGGFWEVFDD